MAAPTAFSAPAVSIAPPPPPAASSPPVLQPAAYSDRWSSRSELGQARTILSTKRSSDDRGSSFIYCTAPIVVPLRIRRERVSSALSEHGPIQRLPLIRLRINVEARHNALARAPSHLRL